MNKQLFKKFHSVIKKKILFLFSKQNILFLFSFAIGSIIYIYEGSSATCYDITTGHQCTQSKPNIGFNRDSVKNQNLARSYRIQRVVNAFSEKLSCSNTSVFSEQNIIDIYWAIEKSQLNEREKFVCKMAAEIRKKMEEILEDRQFMKNYIAQKQANADIKENDKIKMTGLLIKYRLLKNKDNICNPYVTKAGECYFSSARFEVPTEIFIKINESALKYVNQEGEPKKCLFNRREYPLDSDQCADEILSRVQVIPAPLILAQAAQESGWGNPNNKWVSQYNNLLGLQIQFNNPPTMSCYKNCRCTGSEKSRCALKFTDVGGCFHEYAMRFNANPHQMYKEFRKARKNLKNIDDMSDTTSQCQNARALVPYLKDYAEEKKYVHFICDRLNDNICEIFKKCPNYQLI